MQIKFKVSKIANQFFFISNLSEWHFSCREEYNKVWIATLGSLSVKEKEALKKFKTILAKYSFTFKGNKSMYLGRPFLSYSEKRAWEEIRKIVKRVEFEEIKKTFEIFHMRFVKIWNSDSKRILLTQSKNLQNYFKSPKAEGVQIINDLNKVLGGKRKVKNIEVILLASPLKGRDITAAGSANIGNKRITLEMPNLKPKSWEFEYSIGILAHEIGHVIFNENRGREKIQKVLQKLKLPSFVPDNIHPRHSTLEFINETIIELLVPGGYLSQKYFKIYVPFKYGFSKNNLRTLGEDLTKLAKKKRVSGHRLRKFLVWQAYPMTIFYVESGRAIDELFIKNLADLGKYLFKKIGG